MNGYLPIEKCKTCSFCCHNMGCHLSPDDIKDLTFDSLIEEIDKGYLSIDWWDGEDNIKEFYIRIRNVNSPVIDPSYGGVCSLLTKNGCLLSFEDRPKGARFLEPKDDCKCVSRYSKEDCKNDWLEHSDLLNRVYMFYLDKYLEGINEWYINNLL